MTGEVSVLLNPDYTYGEMITFHVHSELRMDSVSQGGEELETEWGRGYFPYTSALITRQYSVRTSSIDLSKPIVFKYHGWFNYSRVRSNSDFMRIDETGVYLRGYYYSLWFPVVIQESGQPYPVDFKSVTLRVPKRLRPLFTGELLEERVEGDQRVSRWQSLQTGIQEAQAMAREWEITEGAGITIYHLKNSASKAAAEKCIERGRTILDFYEQWYRPARASYESVLMEMPRYGDISSGNIVGVSGDFWRGESDGARFFNTYSHELVHPYVHFSVERENPLYAFLVEAVPSYFHLPAMAEVFGEEYYGQLIRRYEEIYLYNREHDKNERGIPVPESKPLTEIAPDEIGTYKDLFLLGNRGKLFFNFLRCEMGKEQFLRFSKEFTSRNSWELESFVSLIEQFLPSSRDDVLIWLTTTEYPERFHLAAPEEK